MNSKIGQQKPVVAHHLQQVDRELTNSNRPCSAPVHGIDGVAAARREAAPYAKVRPIVVRRADYPDCGRLRMIEAAALNQLSAGKYQEPHVASFVVETPDMKASLEHRRCLVAEIDGAIVGWSAWKAAGSAHAWLTSNRAHPPPHARVIGIFVDPRSARRGAGAALIRAVEVEMAEAGHRQADLRCSTHTRSFFKALGFVDEYSGSSPKSDWRSTDVIHMSKAL